MAHRRRWRLVNVRGSCGHQTAGFLFVLGVVVALAGNARAGEITREQGIKAAFIYNFTKFVEWPAASFTNETAPVIIGVQGSEPFAKAMELAVAGRKLNGRRFEVRPVASVAEAKAAHVLFCSGEADRGRGEWLAALKGHPILTVGESNVFLKQGGIIAFVVEDDRVRFDIDHRAAAQGGLKISSQLLKLARRVHQ